MSETLARYFAAAIYQYSIKTRDFSFAPKIRNYLMTKLTRPVYIIITRPVTSSILLIGLIYSRVHRFKVYLISKKLEYGFSDGIMIFKSKVF